jgi:hypothetical protein
VTGFIHNSEMVGPLSDLSTDIGGTESAPQTLIPDTTPTAQGDQWEVDATDMENGNQLVFVNEFAPVVGSEFDRFTGHSGIAVMSIGFNGMPTLRSVTPVPTDTSTQWGTALMQSGTYAYIYGSDFNAASNHFYGMRWRGCLSAAPSTRVPGNTGTGRNGSAAKTMPWRTRPSPC